MTKPILPRDVFLAVDRCQPAGNRTSHVLIHFPTRGMLRAEKLGLVRCYEQVPAMEGYLRAFERTEEGERKHAEYVAQARARWER